MGGFPDLFGQNSQQLRVPEMGPHMPAQLPVHLRSRLEFQPFTGTQRLGLQGKLIKNAQNTVVKRCHINVIFVHVCVCEYTLKSGNLKLLPQRFIST